MQHLASQMLAFDAFNMAPTTSPEGDDQSEDSFPEHDFLSLDLAGDDLQDTTQTAPDGKRKSKRPPSTAERRATHNAVERARRESLNGRFMELAGALPNMVNVKRPSKSIIVAKSLEFVAGAQAREQYLIGQNDALRAEVNELRARLGMPALAAASPVSSNNGALPATQQRSRKASTVSTISTAATSNESQSQSPVLNTPVTLQGGFVDTTPLTPAGYNFNAAFATAFSDPMNQASQAVQQQQQVAPQQVPVQQVANAKVPTPVAYTQSLPQVHQGLDVNYLMALSLQQQQQQQNMLNLQNMPASYSAAVAPWLVAHHPNMPVAVGGDSSWLFS